VSFLNAATRKDLPDLAEDNTRQRYYNTSCLLAVSYHQSYYYYHSTNFVLAAFSLVILHDKLTKIMRSGIYNKHADWIHIE